MGDVTTTTSTSAGGRVRTLLTRLRPWRVLIGFLLVIAVIVGVGLATSSGGGSGRSSSSSEALCSNKLVQMENSGAMQAMIEQHQQMLEQMRVALSPQMQQMMDNDPMWKSMRSGDFTQMFQDQQAAIDQMLGESSTCGAR